MLVSVPAHAVTTATLVKDLVPGSSSPDLANLTNVNGTLFFISINDNTLGKELWKSDSTENGTVMIKELSTQGISSNTYLANVNGILFFITEEGLWKSDGTTGGTVLIKTIPRASELVNVNGTAYFFALGTGLLAERGLWKSDGTSEGTMLVKSLMADTLVNANGTLFFRGLSNVTGEELWKSDGTAAGTVMVKDISTDLQGPGPGYITAVNSDVFFVETEGAISGNPGLWRSNGTDAGTIKLMEGSIENLTNVNGTLFFSGYPGIEYHGLQRGLWKSDGTVAGTIFVKNTSGMPGGDGGYISNIGPLVNFNGTLLFQADNGNGAGVVDTGGELWRSDGTATGTYMVKDIYSGPIGSGPGSFTNVNGTIFFTATTEVNGNELWKTDGTEAGTVLVSDINPGSSSSNIAEPKASNGTLFFLAEDGTHGQELWKAQEPQDTTPPVVSNLTWSNNPLLQGQNASLSATASDDASGVSKVEYTVDGGPRQAMAYDSATNTWKASFGSSLAVNTYNINVIATDGAGNESAGNVDVLAVYNATNGYVTGHERLTPSATDTLPIARDTSNKTDVVLGFSNVKAATSTAPTAGSFDLNYIVKNHKNEFSLSSTAVDWVVVPDNTHASILGHANLTSYVNGVQTVLPNVTVRFDITLGANGAADHVTIKIYDADVNPNTGTAHWVINDNATKSQVMIKP